MKMNFEVGCVEFDCFGYEMSDEEIGLWRIDSKGEWVDMERDLVKEVLEMRLDEMMLCEMEREVLSLR